MRKLDPDSKRQWMMDRPRKVIAKLEPLLEFIIVRADGIDDRQRVKQPQFVVSVPQSYPATNRLNYSTYSRSMESTNQSNQNTQQLNDQSFKKQNLKCVVCNQPHSIYKCPTFQKLDLESRKRKVESLRLCQNCLRRHSQNKCTLSGCKHCGKFHNGLICDSVNRPSINTAVLQNTENRQEDSKSTLLPTINVIASDKVGRPVTLRALCDTGSQINLITTESLQRLKLPKQDSLITLNGISSSDAVATIGTTHIQITSRFSKNNSINIKAHVLKKITTQLPTSEIDKSDWDHILGLPMADPYFNIPAGIDILLGAEVYGTIIKSKIKRGENGAPIAQSTKFGWIVFGSSGTVQNKNSIFHTISEIDDVNEGINASLQRFWALEKVQEKIPRRNFV